MSRERENPLDALRQILDDASRQVPRAVLGLGATALLTTVGSCGYAPPVTTTIDCHDTRVAIDPGSGELRSECQEAGKIQGSAAFSRNGPRVNTIYMYEFVPKKGRTGEVSITVAHDDPVLKLVKDNKAGKPTGSTTIDCNNTALSVDQQGNLRPECARLGKLETKTAVIDNSGGQTIVFNRFIPNVAPAEGDEPRTETVVHGTYFFYNGYYGGGIIDDSRPSSYVRGNSELVREPVRAINSGPRGNTNAWARRTTPTAARAGFSTKAFSGAQGMNTGRAGGRIGGNTFRSGGIGSTGRAMSVGARGGGGGGAS